MKWFILLTGLFAVSAFAQLPDKTVTPGATNPAVTQENIRDTICKSGWTKTIRPPTSYTNALKLKLLADTGIDPHKMELDHYCPIELAGHPSDPNNLWAEPWYLNVDGREMGAHQKDRAETATKRAVCSGKITLEDAQKQMMEDWTVLYRRFVKPEFPKYVPH